MKKTLSVILALLIVLTFVLPCTVLTASAGDVTPEPSKWDGTVPAADQTYVFGGEGTEASPYIIDSAAEFAQFAANIRDKTEGTAYAGKFFKLTVDIDLDSKPWYGIGGCQVKEDGTPINGVGATDAGESYFSGTFDGNGHVIYNLTLADNNHINGLFGHVSGGVIKNLGIESGNSVLNDCTRVGTLVGALRHGAKVYNCYSKANISITYSTFTGQLQIASFIALIIDTDNSVDISRCYSTGKITATDVKGQYRVGGFLGNCIQTNTITDCFSLSDVSVTTEKTDVGSNFSAGSFFGNAMDRPILTNLYAGGKVNVINSSDGTSISGNRGSLAGYLANIPNSGALTGCTYSLPTGTMSKSGSGNITDENSGFTAVEQKGLSDFLIGDAKFIVSELPVFRGTQETSLTGGASVYNVRFLSVITDMDFFAAGYEVNAAYSTGEKNYSHECTAVYKKVLASAPDGLNATYTAEELGGNYIFALTISDIPVSLGQVTFTVTPYAVKDGVRVTGTEYSIVYNAGVFVSATPVA